MRQLATLILIICLASFNLISQVKISDNNNTTIDVNAILDLDSDTLGLLPPKVEINNLNSAFPLNAPITEGMLVYSDGGSVDDGYYFWNGSSWQTVGSGVTLLWNRSNNTISPVTANDSIDIGSGKIIAGQAIIGDWNGTDDGSPGNTGSLLIEEDGSLSYKGAATRWEDLRVAVSATRKGAAEDPTFKKFLDDGSGSVGVYAQHFKTNATEDLFFEVQLPHGWKEGSTIYAHVHWSPESDVGNDKVRWGLEYTWASPAGTFSNTTIIYGEDPITLNGTVTTAEHAITALGTSGIDGAGHTLSSMILCRIFRDGNHANDTYSDEVILLEIDFHLEVDADGSRLEYIK